MNTEMKENGSKYTMSETRKRYFLRLIGRCAVLVVAVLLYIADKTAFAVAEDWNFFSGFSPLHVLWGIWIWDMVLQLLPVRAHISIGSQKQFSAMFKPIKEKINYNTLKEYVIATTKSAYKVFLLWAALHVVIGFLYASNRIDTAEMVLLSVFFYVCDLICVLIWCPFRLIMKNKCCTTCRIFNWDHLMMFTPFIFVRGFYTWSLVLLALVIWIVWEICVFTYPERFWENSNMALRCTECTDKLCTQYCRKLRK